MSIGVNKTSAAFAALAILALATTCGAATGDFNEDGFVDLLDYEALAICLDTSGPGTTPLFTECAAFDFDDDDDVDLRDIAVFERKLRTHLPFPLLDYYGNVITLASTEPYSGRQTCSAGGCHDVDHITNGFLFEMGRTNLAGDVDMQDDYDGDGRFWNKSAARYGIWGQTFVYLLAAKENTNESQIEQGAFDWVAKCSSCHPGGGPTEYDRDDQLLYNVVTDEFGYELLGKTPEQVVLDGDYCDMNYSTGALSPAPWDVTGVSGPDCFYCHRNERILTRDVDRAFDVSQGFRGAGRGDMNFSWRASVLATGVALVDDLGDPVPAYAAAGTAGQGWFTTLDTASVPPVLQIDYQVGVDEGSFLVGDGDELSVATGFMTRPPKDRACDSCHVFAVVTGSTWFDERDIHYRKFTNRNDEDPSNDIPHNDATVCTVCHPGDVDHNFGRGDSFQLNYRDELDFAPPFLTCRNCHLYELSPGVPNPLKHADAPDVLGGTDQAQLHFAGDAEKGPMAAMSCQACHIPYSLAGGLIFRDNTVGVIGFTSDYYSADPLNPSDPDKSVWYPSLRWKMDSDGKQRLFPSSDWVIFYWGDWDKKDTPEDLSDDIIRPLIAWRLTQVLGSEPLPVVQDDDGDGRLEIDQPEELLAYFALLKGNDSYGRQVAANPVLVRGPRVWYEEEPGAINSFEHEGTGIPVDSYPYIWGKDHNVVAAVDGWGAGFPPNCDVCHRIDGQSPVFDRLILVDPYPGEGQPKYRTISDLTGASPPPQ